MIGSSVAANHHCSITFSNFSFSPSVEIALQILIQAKLNENLGDVSLTDCPLVAWLHNDLQTPFEANDKCDSKQMEQLRNEIRKNTCVRKLCGRSLLVSALASVGLSAGLNPGG